MHQKKLIRAGLFGQPLSSSLSPEVFAVFSRLIGMEIVFELHETDARNLPHEIDTARAAGWDGFSVTLPHKRAVLDLLNLADPAAKGAGAVNAVRFGRMGLEGLNTDARALLQVFEARGIETKGRSAAVYGAGGAAGSAAWALGRAGAASVALLARDGDKAAELAERLGDCFPATKYSAGPFAAPALPPDIAVHATPLGMYQPGLAFAPERGRVCVDFAYARGGTDLTRLAEKAGAVSVDGIELLVAQGALALRHWAGLPAGDIVKFTREALVLLRPKIG